MIKDKKKHRVKNHYNFNIINFCPNNGIKYVVTKKLHSYQGRTFGIVYDKE